ncbi:uncharacterized protein LOC100375487 [Saccoglossus kowalevskii]|uniref:Uncharacterized protein LOC100375487 n=1 Tax=Saccoglossus kowalevskii TaxID=10224 RepID=A0ABM0GW02_SACKO|nr:PREDICTED: uncharacterized protein LOC100375487 [Saccoglossus kowalevskii]
MSDIKRLAKLRNDNQILLDQLRRNQENVKSSVSSSNRPIRKSRSPRLKTPLQQQNEFEVSNVSSIHPDYRDRSPVGKKTRNKHVIVERTRTVTSSTPKRPRKPRSVTPSRNKSPIQRQWTETPNKSQELMGSFLTATDGKNSKKIPTKSSSVPLPKKNYCQAQEEDNTCRYSEFLNSFTERSKREGLRPRKYVPKYEEELLAHGNDRRHAKLVRDMSKPPKSILMTPGGKNNKSQAKVSFISPDPRLPADFDERNAQPLLGYDWIAGLLENDESIAEKSQTFFDEIREFRRVNNNECQHRSFTEEPVTPKSTKSPKTSKPKMTSSSVEEKDEHKCIHSYALNNRLYAVPIHKTTDGDSECPICKTGRRQDNRRGSPSYIRVSIPRSTLVSPYRLRPHRRKSFDPSDSYALSQHCLAGWESSKPSMMPSAHSMDLKDSLDVPSKAAAMSTIGKWANKVPVSLSSSKRTSSLLNTSHSLRYSMQQIEKERPFEKLPPPKSTNYPLL